MYRSLSDCRVVIACLLPVLTGSTRATAEAIEETMLSDLAYASVAVALTARGDSEQVRR